MIPLLQASASSPILLGLTILMSLAVYISAEDNLVSFFRTWTGLDLFVWLCGLPPSPADYFSLGMLAGFGGLFCILWLFDWTCEHLDRW